MTPEQPFVNRSFNDLGKVLSGIIERRVLRRRRNAPPSTVQVKWECHDLAVAWAGVHAEVVRVPIVIVDHAAQVEHGERSHPLVNIHDVGHGLLECGSAQAEDLGHGD